MMVCRTSPPSESAARFPGPGSAGRRPGPKGAAVFGVRPRRRRHHQAVPGQDQRLLDVLDLTDEVVQQPAQLSGRVSLCHYSAPLSVGSHAGSALGIVEIVHAPAPPPLLHQGQHGARRLRRSHRRLRVPRPPPSQGPRGPHRLGPAVAGPGWPAEPGWASRDGCRTTPHRAARAQAVTGRDRACRDRAGRRIRPQRLAPGCPGLEPRCRRLGVPRSRRGHRCRGRRRCLYLGRQRLRPGLPGRQRVGPGCRGPFPGTGGRVRAAPRRDGGQPVSSGQGAETTVARPVVSPAGRPASSSRTTTPNGSRTMAVVPP